MGLTGKCLQVCLVQTKMFSKWYPLLLLLLREVYPSSEILEQDRVSQRKGIAIQASSRKHPECASLSKEGLSLQSKGRVIWMYSLERVMYYAFCTHTHRTLSCGLQAPRTMNMFKLANKWVSFITRAFIFMIGTQKACFSKLVTC